MMQKPHRYGAVLQRHLEGTQRQGRGHLLTHRPANNAARIEIHQHRDIEPALARGDVGDVARPLLIRPGGHKLSPQGVCRCDLRGCPRAGSPDSAAADTADVMEPHQSRDTMTAHPKPLRLQLLVNPRTAVPASRSLITGPNVRHQALILLCAPTHRAVAPGIEPTPGDVEHSTQYAHRIDRLLRLDKTISHSDSLAKKATAFFKMSRSMRNCSTSRRNTFSSSVARKLFVPRGAVATCRIHRLNVGCGMPSSRATWHSLFPLRRHKSTASCLNSGVKLRRGWPMRHLPSLIMHGRCPQNQGKSTLAGMGLSE